MVIDDEFLVVDIFYVLRNSRCITTDHVYSCFYTCIYIVFRIIREQCDCYETLIIKRQMTKKNSLFIYDKIKLNMLHDGRDMVFFLLQNK